jgi:hypothetical protein
VVPRGPRQGGLKRPPLRLLEFLADGYQVTEMTRLIVAVVPLPPLPPVPPPPGRGPPGGIVGPVVPPPGLVPDGPPDPSFSAMLAVRVRFTFVS